MFIGIISIIYFLTTFLSFQNHISWGGGIYSIKIEFLNFVIKYEKYNPFIFNSKGVNFKIFRLIDILDLSLSNLK
jgi:hypothetical protein